jgi:hypothetical protein
MTSLPEMVVEIEERLHDADVPHAFGGALALAYHVLEPRGTRDIDVNIFVGEHQARETLQLLPAGVQWDERDLEQIERDGQVRLFWEGTPIDLFFATHPFHLRAGEHALRVPFTGTTMPVLGATELTVFKAFFDRTKDWADIEAMVDAGTVDIHAALGWLVDLLGSDDHRVDRLRRLIDRKPPTAEPRFTPKH